VSYIRFRKQFLHIPYLLLGVLEFCLLFFVYRLLASGVQLVISLPPELTPGTLAALVFSLMLSAGTLSMGGYSSLANENATSLFFRTLVAYCFVGGLGLTITYLFVPALDPGSSALFYAVALSSLIVILCRLIFLRVVGSEQLVRRVVVFGAGPFAANLMQEYDQNMRAMGVRIIGCIADNPDQAAVKKDQLLPTPVNFHEFCRRNKVSEIVIAAQERRQAQGGFLPMAGLMECKLRGITVTSGVDFYERELKKAKLDMLHPSWILFSEGFSASRSRAFAKRFVDLALSLTLLAIMSPFIILTAIAVFLETGRPVLYSQQRIGLLGKEFRIYKFRSMRQDAEKDGKARWASANDNRITRVGGFIRNTRLDELPQIYNVIKGEMSFVGPRPERPEFVSELKEKIPFYDTRHYVKPGLMGWAQLKYPYGASVEDAKGKLEYDLYYSKNHSLLMDILILIQTVEVVLLGKGVR
jgi:sugar transferase (PEP-CTERM system associated)